MSNVIEIVNKVKSNPHIFYIGLIGILIIIIILISNSCQNKDYELAKADQNIEALRDSVRIETNKVGEKEYARLLIVAEKDELERFNKDLFDEMSKMKGKIVALSKVTLDMKGVLEGMRDLPNDGDYVQPILKDSILTTTFNFDSTGTGWKRQVSGKTVVKLNNITDSTNAYGLYNILDKDRMTLTIYPGIRKREGDGRLEYTIRTDYPGVEFDIQGYADPTELTDFSKIKEDKWIIGPYLGLGLGATNTQIQGSNAVLFGPNLSIGIGVMYKLFGF